MNRVRAMSRSAVRLPYRATMPVSTSRIPTASTCKFRRGDRLPPGAQGRGRLGGHTMVRRLLIGITQLEQLGLAIGAAKEGDADGKIVRGESRRHRYRRDKDKEGIERRYALLADIRRVDAVLDEGRLMLEGFVDNGVETIVGHHLQDGGHQLAAGFQIVAELRSVCRLERRPPRVAFA